MTFGTALIVAAIIICALGLGLGLGFGLRGSSSPAPETAPLPSGDIKAFWYKPHYQCGASSGTTPQDAANFINAQLTAEAKTDFVAISEWEAGLPIGNTDFYGSIGAVCGYDWTPYTTPIVLFYKLDGWSLEGAYPPSPSCALVPSPPWEGPQIGKVCVNKTRPDGDNCCSCTYSSSEYAVGNSMGQDTGQRPWVAGIFSKNGNEDEKVCVVAAEFPHPLANVTLWDVNGVPTSDPRPFSIMRYVCTGQLQPEICVPNLEDTAVMFGTDNFVQGVGEFCKDVPIILMADTNAGTGDFTTSSMFLTEPLISMEGVAPLVPYACCNDTAYGGGLNRYASDRIQLTGDKLKIDLLQGGSTAPGGPLPDDMTYHCHANEEHAPLRAYISVKK